MRNQSLGNNQREFLIISREMGAYPCAGWQWTNYSTTVSIAKTLIKRGLIVEKMNQSIYKGMPPYKSFELTEEGRNVADELIRRRESVKAQRRAQANG